jgi:hypothetical protein
MYRKKNIGILDYRFRTVGKIHVMLFETKE